MIFSIDDHARRNHLALIYGAADASWTYGELSDEVVDIRLGIALTALIPSQDAAAPIVNALLLPLYFLSGIFIPDDELPSGVIEFANHFPIRDFFQAFFTAYLPGGGSGLDWGNLAVVAVWGVAGLLLAIRFFRWTPRAG